MAAQNCVLQQLNTYQSNILTLFQGVVKERNEYKEGNDFLVETIKQVSDKVENLERQNELLRSFNSSMKCIFNVGIIAFKKVDFSHVSCTEDNLTYLELLKKIFIDLSVKITDPALHALSENTSEGLKKRAIGMIEYEGLDDKTKIKNTDFDDAEAVTQLIEKFNVDDDFIKEMKVESEGNSIEWASWTVSKYLNAISALTPGGGKKGLLDEIDAASSGEANARISASVSDPAESVPGPSGLLGTVFKDALKQDFARSQDNDNPQKLAKEKVAKSTHLMVLSPLKKSTSFDQGSCSKTPVHAPKRAKMLANINIKKRSPGGLRSILKEPGVSGKKYTQSVLNLKCLKENGPETEGNNSEKGKGENMTTNTQVICDSDSDDFITESPIKLNRVLERSRMNDEDRNLDETFINSSVVHKFNSKNNHGIEKIFRTSRQQKRAKQKSPEYDSVPFAYKRETVRKRKERMKLPGHPCVECNKYYQNALGDLNGSDLKKVLNKCSRHRDKNPPSLEDTPPGYWKPYLTCSTAFSPNKDDAR